MTPAARIAIGVLAGAALGFLYHRLVGCSTGACPLTARWWTATLYGALMGALLSR
jgi:hypothetical protein